MDTLEALRVYRDTAEQIRTLKAAQGVAKQVLLSAIELGALDQNDDGTHYLFPSENLKLTTVARRTWKPSAAVKEQIDHLLDASKFEGEGSWNQSVSLRLSEIKDEN